MDTTMKTILIVMKYTGQLRKKKSENCLLPMLLYRRKPRDFFEQSAFSLRLGISDRSIGIPAY